MGDRLDWQTPLEHPVCDECAEQIDDEAPVCEGCGETDGSEQPYRVAHHDGTTDEAVMYCAACADLARIDWNGETASIEAVARA